MFLNDDIKLDFDDVMIQPKRSTKTTRSEINLHRDFKFPHSPIKFNAVPIIAANMDTVGTISMAKAFSPFKTMVALHKFYEPNVLINFYSSTEWWHQIFYTVGMSQEDHSKLMRVSFEVNRKNPDAKYPFPHLICIDVANGYMECFVEKVKQYREIFPHSVIMSGNVVTPNMAEELIVSGADIIKVGLGSGGCCLTRVMTGVGYPQFSAVVECADVAHGLNGHICSDGGCSKPADLAKAFGAGADFVMLGSMLSGFDECEGEWEYNEQGQKKSLLFYGMSSETAMNKYYGGVPGYRASEGRTVRVPYKGSVTSRIKNIMGGITSAFTYTNATKIKDFSKVCTFNRVNRTHNRIFEDDKNFF